MWSSVERRAAQGLVYPDAAQPPLQYADGDLSRPHLRAEPVRYPKIRAHRAEELADHRLAPAWPVQEAGAVAIVEDPGRGAPCAWTPVVGGIICAQGTVSPTGKFLRVGAAR